MNKKNATMPVEPSQFAILSEKLSVLLGFSDGVVDLLEHLLAIESKAVSATVKCSRSWRIM
jgi:hypothetical protein